MRYARRVVLLVWSVICGFAAQAVVFALAQLVLDLTNPVQTTIAIVLQLATFGLVTAYVYTRSANGPTTSRRRRTPRRGRVTRGAAPPARLGDR